MNQASEWVHNFKRDIPSHISKVENYVESLKSITADEIVDDFVNFRITPATVTISITAVTTLLFIGSYLSSAPSPKAKSKKSKKPKKKVSKAQRANLDIQGTLDFVELEYVPKIDDYIENYKTLLKEDREYKFKYFEEMLLKQLMKLDGIDVIGNDILRDNRKKVIKFIQDHQKRLDKTKKDN